MACCLKVFCIAIVCVVFCHAMPQGNLNLLDNAILQDLNDEHEKYLTEFDQENGSDTSSQCKANSTSNDIFPYPLHASCRVEW